MASPHEFWIAGLLLAFLSFLIPFLHFINCLRYYKSGIITNDINDDIELIPKITILLPVKNEEIVIKEKLTELFGMDYPLEKIFLLILDSQSKDRTILFAEDFLEKYPTKINYKIIKIDKPGKSYAVNRGIDLINTEFFIMMDAESILFPNSLLQIMKWFTDESIGAVCGKFNPQIDDLDYDYRKNFNILRIGESAIHSTPIFEGSICAFRKKALGGKKLISNINSDDTQLSLLSIRNGYRSIMDKELIFLEPPTEGKNRKIRQLRRSQGLIRVLLKNWNMIFKSNIKGIYFNTYFFYIIMPWTLSISIFCLFASALMNDANNSSFYSISIYDLSFFLFLTLFGFKFFRNLFFGIYTLIKAQLLILFGVKLHIWDTNASLRQKSSDFRKNSDHTQR